MNFNDTYLNKTPHKSKRVARELTVLWHETAGTAESSLNWLMDPSNGGISWHYLIARDGTLYACLDPRTQTAWHAGPGSISNEVTIGVEVEGPNDGTPITATQRARLIYLMQWFAEEMNIPLASDRHLAHKDTATPKGRKTDPRGYDVAEVLKAAQAGQEASMQVLETYPAGTRFRTIGSPVNVRRIPELRSDALMSQLTQVGTGFFVDKLVTGDAHKGSNQWVHAPNMGYVHRSLVEPEPAGSGGDSPERTARLIAILEENRGSLAKLQECLKEAGFALSEAQLRIGLSLADLKGKQP